MPVSAPQANAPSPSLQRAISPLQFVALGFGSIVGSAWAVLLGDWLRQAGPGGAMIGIAAGAAAMALIAAFYAELGSRFPQTGGEVTYINAVFGKRLAFVAGWMLTLAFMCVTVFEGVALVWLLEILWPPIVGPILYDILGQPIGLGGLLVALASAAVIATLNYRGARALVRFQSVLTAAFILIVGVIVVVELYYGSARNILPVWRTGNGTHWWVGAAWVFASAPYILSGFQSILQAIEERSPSTSNETVVRLVFVAIAAAAVFYWLVLTGAAMAAPWMSLTSSDFPAAAALAHLPWSRALTAALLISLIASVLKTWNGMFMIAVRLLLAQAKAGMIPEFFGGINPRTQTPDRAVIVVAVFNLTGLFFGKGALEPIVSMTSLCFALCYVLCCAAALTMRRRSPHHAGFRVPGGTPAGVVAIGFSLAIAGLALARPYQSGQADTLKWVLLGSWAALGLGFYYCARNRKPPARQPADSRIGAEP